MAGSFAPGLVTAQINNKTASGFAEGTMVEYEFNEESIKSSRGAQGDVEVTVLKIDDGVVKLSLQPSSPFNQYMLSLWKLQKKGDASVIDGFPVMVRSRTAQNELLDGKKGFIKKGPATVFTSENRPAKLWEIFVSEMEVSELTEFTG